VSGGRFTTRTTPSGRRRRHQPIEHLSPFALLRQDTPYLALLAAGAIIATAAACTVLQAVDGVTLKQAVDAWVAAPGTEEAARFADAETVRWTARGLQSYFRVLLGVAFLLLALRLS
jgi:hypothetical protein